MFIFSLNIFLAIIAFIQLVSAFNVPYSLFRGNLDNFQPNDNIFDPLEADQQAQDVENDFVSNNLALNAERGSIWQFTEQDLPNQENIKKFGQIAGLSGYKNDTVYVFHRNDRFWGYGLSDLGESGDDKITKPITNDTITILDSNNGQIIKSWGANSFYMPHGISLDSNGNVWLTDVFSHQVFKYKSDSYDKPELVLGEAFISGQDDSHFCMPTDVAVSTSGIIYISDGYCNSRIMIYSPYGEPIDEIAIEENMIIPHSLTLIEDDNLICVADREKRRILCYEAGLDGLRPGMLVVNVEHPRLNRIFALDHLNRDLIALSVDDDSSRSEAIVVDVQSGNLINSFTPKNGFKEPHDLSISSDGKYVFISDISSSAEKSIYKFKTSA